MSLALTYRIIWQLKTLHEYSLTEIYDMLPYERDIFIDMINDHEQKKENNAANNS